MVTDDEIRHAIDLARTKKQAQGHPETRHRSAESPQGTSGAADRVPGPRRQARTRAPGKPGLPATPPSCSLRRHRPGRPLRNALHRLRDAHHGNPSRPTGAELIAKVREVYKGPLVYNGCLETMWDVRWWDAVDILGISVLLLAAKGDRQLRPGSDGYWTKWRDGMRALAARPPGPSSSSRSAAAPARGASTMSGDFNPLGVWPYDGREQADFLRSRLPRLLGRALVLRLFLVGLARQALPPRRRRQEQGVLCYGKPAEQILRPVVRQAPPLTSAVS